MDRKRSKKVRYLSGRPDGPAPEPGPIRANLYSLLLDNLKFVVTFLPAAVGLHLFLAVGGVLILTAAMALLCLAGPACAAMFETGFAIARGVSARERRGFFASYAANFRQGATTMGLIALVLLPYILCMVAAAQREGGAPLWLPGCLILEGVALLAFAINAFSQIALVDLPLGKIWKNALLLIPGLGLKGVGAALLSGLGLAAVYQWLPYSVPAVLVLLPALGVTLICLYLRGDLERTLVDQG